jgi:hypothetical protein
MLLLIILALQTAATGATTAPHGTSSYSSLPLPLPKVDILVSTTYKVTLYSCFFMDDIVEADLKSGKDACCKGVIEAWQKVDDIYNSNNSIITNNDDDDGKEDSASDALLHRRCLLEIAQVPSVVSDLLTTLENNDNNDSNDGKENITPSAKFSWIVSNSIIISSESTTRQETTSKTSLKQYMWTNQSHDRQKDSSNEVKLQLQPIQTTSPYHKAIVQSSMSMSMSNSTLPTIVTVEQNSYLDREGGMHRLFHHSFQPIISDRGIDETKRSFYLFVIIPQGMFIDLDDPFEAAFSGTIESNPIPPPDTDNININIGISATTATTSAASSYIVINLNSPNDEKSSVLSFRAQLHSATLCDIEQPAFVSGQHVLVWEIDNIVTKNQQQQQEIGNLPSMPPPPVIEFATKLHLRYPHPSSTLEEWIDLSSPLLFSVLPSSRNQLINKEESGVTSKVMLEKQKHHDWDLDFVERVWVAAGKDEDHDWIMTMTISFCLIGVVIMLRDISMVSLWDDV